MNFRNFLNVLLSTLNVKLVNKKFSGIVDKRDLSPFQINNENFSLYYEGIKKSKNIHTDNFYKQSRFLDLINLTEMILKKKEEKI